VITYNAALNRPAYQPSILNDRYPAHLANDGSRHTIYNTGTKCAHTDTETNPWWAVDLGRPTTVYGVVLTNRAAVGSVNIFNVATDCILPTEIQLVQTNTTLCVFNSDLLS